MRSSRHASATRSACGCRSSCASHSAASAPTDTSSAKVSKRKHAERAARAPPTAHSLPNREGGVVPRVEQPRCERHPSFRTMAAGGECHVDGAERRYQKIYCSVARA